MLGESCTAENQGKAMSYMSLGWGMGTVLGPMVGGFLALPCDGFAASSSLCKPGALLQNRRVTPHASASAVIACRGLAIGGRWRCQFASDASEHVAAQG